jgi:hypothetical protein
MLTDYLCLPSDCLIRAQIIPSDYMVGGDRLNIIVLDNDLNKDPTVVETISVRVTTLKVSQSQTITPNPKHKYPHREALNIKVK